MPGRDQLRMKNRLKKAMALPYSYLNNRATTELLRMQLVGTSSYF